MDLDRIRKNDGYVYLWSLADYLKPTKSGYMSDKAYREVDCEAFRYKNLTYIFYKQPMGEGEGNSETSRNQEWQYPPPESNIEIMLNFVCGE